MKPEIYDKIFAPGNKEKLEEMSAQPFTEHVIPGTGAPRCSRCFGPWGQCEHTGGPIVALDPRVSYPDA